MDGNCTTFPFGQAVSITHSVVDTILGSVVVILYFAVVVALVRRQRQWTIDPDDAEINRQLKREVLVFALPVSIFVVSFVIAITYEVVGDNYALLILVAVFSTQPPSLHYY